MIQYTIRKELQVMTLYRRLRLLFNRINQFGLHLFFPDGICYTFNTELGKRDFICLSVDDGVNEYYYYNDDDLLFKIVSSKSELSFISDLNPMDMWTAIYEIENLTDDILKEKNDNI